MGMIPGPVNAGGLVDSHEVMACSTSAPLGTPRKGASEKLKSQGSKYLQHQGGQGAPRPRHGSGTPGNTNPPSAAPSIGPTPRPIHPYLPQISEHPPKTQPSGKPGRHDCFPFPFLPPPRAFLGAFHNLSFLDFDQCPSLLNLNNDSIFTARVQPQAVPLKTAASSQEVSTWLGPCPI